MLAQAFMKVRDSPRTKHYLLLHLIFIAKVIVIQTSHIDNNLHTLMRSVKLNKNDSKKLMKKEKQEKEVVGIDFGNCWFNISYANKEIVLANSLFLERGNVYIGKKPNPQCIIDAVSVLAKKWEDKSFQNIVKYYDIVFKKGANRNIVVESRNDVFGQEYYLQLPVILAIKGIFAVNPTLKFLTLSQKQMKLVVTVFEGKLNPYRLALKECFKLNKLSDIFFVNTSTCIASSYIKDSKKSKDESEVVGIVDFGAEGMTLSIHRLFFMQPGVVQTLMYQISDKGGIFLTQLLVNYITQKLIKDKGMDINKSTYLMHKLKLLCDQAKHILSSNDRAFIRLDQLPDIKVYGCEVSVQQFQKCIQEAISRNVEIICKNVRDRAEKVGSIILCGQSCRIPLFRRMLAQNLPGISLVDANENWVKNGLMSVKSEQMQILDVCPFQVKMQGDEKIQSILVNKGESIPLRKRLALKFPSGELNMTLKFFQNNQLIATVTLPQRPRQNNFSLFVEVDHNKLIDIFATTSQGLIKTHNNFMEIPREEYIKYSDMISKVDFHIDTD